MAIKETIQIRNRHDIEDLNLNPNGKYHTSSEPIESAKDVAIEGKLFGFKPRGFWYSCGDSWIEWMSWEMPDWLNSVKYLYELDIDYSKMLVIDTEEKLILFDKMQQDRTKRHNDVNSYTDKMGGFWGIDWKPIMQNYYGIEICPYQSSQRHSINWYYTWDVASGCIWNAKAIKSVKLADTVDSEMTQNWWYEDEE